VGGVVEERRASILFDERDGGKLLNGVIKWDDYSIPRRSSGTSRTRRRRRGNYYYNVDCPDSQRS